MLELKVLGLVNMEKIPILCSNGITRLAFQIRLKDEFNWFINEEFKIFREGFEPESSNSNDDDDNNDKDNDDSSAVAYSTEDSSSSDLQMELLIQSVATNDLDGEVVIPDSIYRLGHSDKWACENCNIRDDKWCMIKHKQYCNGTRSPPIKHNSEVIK